MSQRITPLLHQGSKVVVTSVLRMLAEAECPIVDNGLFSNWGAVCDVIDKMWLKIRIIRLFL